MHNHVPIPRAPVLDLEELADRLEDLRALDAPQHVLLDKLSAGRTGLLYLAVIRDSREARTGLLYRETKHAMTEVGGWEFALMEVGLLAFCYRDSTSPAEAETTRQILEGIHRAQQMGLIPVYVLDGRGWSVATTAVRSTRPKSLPWSATPQEGQATQ